MIVKYELDPNKPISKKALDEIKEAKDREIVYDNESPQYTKEELELMIRNTKEKGMDRRKALNAL